MKRLKLLPRVGALLFLGGCASAAQAASAVPEADEGPVVLRVAAGEEGARYRRTQSVFVDNGGDGRSLRLVARGGLEVTPEAATDGASGAARFVSTQRYDQTLEVERGGERAPLDASTRGLDSMVVRTVLDEQHRLLEGPDLSGAPSAGRIARIAMVVAHRLFHLSYPEGPVSVGDVWRPDPYRISQEQTHYAEVAVEPELTLLGLTTDDEGHTFARVGWSVDVHVLPFEAMSVSLEGLGRIEGFSEISLEDGVSGRSELDLSIAIGPAGSTDVLPILQVRAKYADRIVAEVMVAAPAAQEERLGEPVTLEGAAAQGAVSEGAPTP